MLWSSIDPQVVFEEANDVLEVIGSTPADIYQKLSTCTCSWNWQYFLVRKYMELLPHLLMILESSFL